MQLQWNTSLKKKKKKSARICLFELALKLLSYCRGRCQSVWIAVAVNRCISHWRADAHQRSLLLVKLWLLTEPCLRRTEYPQIIISLPVKEGTRHLLQKCGRSSVTHFTWSVACKEAPGNKQTGQQRQLNNGGLSGPTAGHGSAVAALTGGSPRVNCFTGTN